jgi:hypothetical protein
MTTYDTARKLLGKRVEVVLSTDGSATGPVVAKGVLLSYCDMGEVVLRGDDGDVTRCWPMLDIRAASLWPTRRYTGESC